MVLDYRDQVLAFVRQRGPVLPMQIAKEVGQTSLMASAMLSELASKGSLKISHLKVGGSPLYYLPGQEGQLEQFSEHLNDKDRRVFDLLKREKVMRDSDHDSLTRVALRNLRDFAIPLNVTHEGQTELFWKWHSLPDEEANLRIRSALAGHPFGEGWERKPDTQKTLEDVTAEPAQAPPVSAEKNGTTQEETTGDSLKKESPQTKQSTASAEAQTGRNVVEDQSAEVTKSSKHFEEQASVSEKEPVPEKKNKERSKPSSDDEDDEKQEEDSAEDSREGQDEKGLSRKEVLEAVDDEEHPESEFFSQVLDFCAENEIRVLSYEEIRKKKEYDLMVEIPSAVGRLNYLIKARDKKRLLNSDIDATFVQGQLCKLPALLLAPGDLSKKGQKYLEEELKGVTFTKLEQKGG